MILTENGSKIFFVHEAWQEHCIENNIVDPWEWMRQCEDKINKHWVETDDKGHTIWHYKNYSLDEWPEELLKEYNQARDYRFKYITMRELWEGQYILEKYGYELLESFYKTHDTDAIYDIEFRKWFSTVKPCQGQEGQCNIFCSQFNDCKFKEKFVPPKEEQK